MRFFFCACFCFCGVFLIIFFFCRGELHPSVFGGYFQCSAQGLNLSLQHAKQMLQPFELFPQTVNGFCGLEQGFPTPCSCPGGPVGLHPHNDQAVLGMDDSARMDVCKIFALTHILSLQSPKMGGFVCFVLTINK